MLSGFAKPSPTPVILPMKYHLPRIEEPDIPSLFASAAAPSVACEIERSEIEEAFWDAWLLSIARECPDTVRSRFGNTLIVKLQSQDEWIILEEVVRAPICKSAVKTSKPRRLFSKKVKHVNTSNSQTDISRIPRSKVSMFPTCKEAERRARSLVQSKQVKDKSWMRASNIRGIKKRSIRLSEAYLIQTGELAAAAMAFISAYDRQPSIFSRSTLNLVSDSAHDQSTERKVTPEKTSELANFNTVTAANDSAQNMGFAADSQKASNTVEAGPPLNDLLKLKHMSLAPSQTDQSASSCQPVSETISSWEQETLQEIFPPGHSSQDTHQRDSVNRPSLFVEQLDNNKSAESSDTAENARLVKLIMESDTPAKRLEDRSQVTSISEIVSKRWHRLREVAKAQTMVKPCGMENQNNLR